MWRILALSMLSQLAACEPLRVDSGAADEIAARQAVVPKVLAPQSSAQRSANAEMNSVGGAELNFVWPAEAPARGDVFAEITGNEPREVPRNYIGMHMHRLVIGPQDSGRLRTEWPDMKFGVLRLWDARVRWADVAPQPRAWSFERLDQYVWAAQSKGVELRYVLGSTPRWASARPDETCPYGYGCSAEPVQINDWTNYVRALARRYKGQISTYELWNEPKFTDLPRDRNKRAFFTGNVAQMVTLARTAREVLNVEDPKARLISPGIVAGFDRLSLFLKSGGKAYIDGIAYHFYSPNSRYFAEQVRSVRAVMKAEGVEHLPLFNTETGIEAESPEHPLPPDAPRRTPEQAVGHVIQFMVLGAAAGLAGYDFYAWDNDLSGAVDKYGAHRPVHQALLRLADWLDGASFQGCKDNGGWVSCRGSVSATPFIVAWSDGGESVKIAPPPGYRLASAQRAAGEADAVSLPDGSWSARLDVIPTLFRFESVSGELH